MILSKPKCYLPALVKTKVLGGIHIAYEITTHARYRNDHNAYAPVGEYENVKDVPSDLMQKRFHFFPN